MVVGDKRVVTFVAKRSTRTLIKIHTTVLLLFYVVMTLGVIYVFVEATPPSSAERSFFALIMDFVLIFAVAKTLNAIYPPIPDPT